MKRSFALIVCLIGLGLSSTAAELKEKTTIAFDKYVAATEARINSELRPGGIFLYVDALQAYAMKSSYDKLMNGEVLVEKRETKGPGLSSAVPDGMVHHWIGIIFIPGVKLAQLLPIMQDYDRRAELYKPDVTASHLISHHGESWGRLQVFPASVSKAFYHRDLQYRVCHPLGPGGSKLLHLRPSM